MDSIAEDPEEESKRGTFMEKKDKPQGKLGDTMDTEVVKKPIDPSKPFQLKEDAVAGRGSIRGKEPPKRGTD